MAALSNQVDARNMFLQSGMKLTFCSNTLCQANRETHEHNAMAMKNTKLSFLKGENTLVSSDRSSFCYDEVQTTIDPEPTCSIIIHRSFHMIHKVQHLFHSSPVFTVTIKYSTHKEN